MAKQKQKYYRHGDLLFLKVDEVPSEFRRFKISPKKHSRGVIVAEGEKTGHHHTLEAAKSYFNYEWRGGRISFVEIDVPTKVEHEEHGTITLDPGLYQINFQKEVDLSKIHYPSTSTLEEATRQVID